jgi:CcmD family protein
MSGGDYLAAAYLVVLLVILVYVAIIGLKLARLDRDLSALVELTRRRIEAPAPGQEEQKEQEEREESRVG